ncbi:MAG: carbohydrate binding domain-containing protein [Candidatus Parcubacteria bacterium]|nr:carbohydrate binding domain-containing protein [Candidatus Parcubacteria bacterium]
MIKLKLKILLAAFALLLLPVAGIAQDANLAPSSQDTLLEQYLFPVSSYLESGAALGKAASECDSFKFYDSNITPPAWVASANCSALTSDSGIVQKTGDGKGIYASSLMDLTYKFSVAQEGNYDFKIKAANSFDNFANLNSQQLDYIFSNSNTTNYHSYQISSDATKSLSVLEYSDDNVITDTNKYDLFKSLIFSVYLDMPAVFAAGDKEENYRKGYIIIPATDFTQLQDGSVLIGNLNPGEHTVNLRFLSDYYFDPSSNPLPGNLNTFDEVNIETGHCVAGANEAKVCQRNTDCPQSTCNKINNILDINPVIAGVSINQTSPTTDIIGVRIYTNKDHKDPETWYRENVIQPTASVKAVKVDGYLGVQDERTIYISAANIDRNNFFTNIYVMAYNQDAAPPSINIFKQMMANWKFNKNKMEAVNLVDAEMQKDKLRRDTVRLADMFKLGRLLDNYKSNHGGKCPVLDAGTYIKNHSISTWPSWQATLGNELGTALPTDPLNIMSTTKESQHDCTNAIDKANCQNICTRDASNNPVTGCPLTQQCMSGYCSSCSSSYDPLTCWDKSNLKFYDQTFFSGCKMTDSEAYSVFDGALRVGASDCKLGLFAAPSPQAGQAYVNDGDFVYQYVSRDNGQSCSFINRFEYTEQDLCQPGFCYYDNNDTNPTNDCYQPGACLAGCDSQGANCVNTQYKNLYCYSGSWKQSCGDGFWQTQCGESCDPNMPMTEGLSWCDRLFGLQDWYNEASIKASCTSSCTISEGGNLTIEDCGGFCGDKVVEAKAGEQCDEGLIPAALKKGSAGFDQNSQYMCSGKGGSSVPVLNGADCVNYSQDWSQVVSLACSSIGPYTYWVKKLPDNLNLIKSDGGFRASYNFNLPQVGGYNLTIKAANWADDLTKLTTSQIDYLISQKHSGDDLYNIKGVCRNSDITAFCSSNDECKNPPSYPDGYCQQGAVDIPEYGLIDPTDNRKYDLLKSLIFSVYVDNDYVDTTDLGQLAGFIIIPASNTEQTGSLFIGGLTAGPHTIFLHFVGDHYYLPNIPVSSTLAEIAAGLPDPLALDINPIIYSVSMYSPQAAVGDCKTYGGWCGDGQVEMQYGEQCDAKNYLPPSAEQTVNIAYNPGFEGYFTPWQKDSGTVILDTDQYFEGRSGLKMVASSADTVMNLQQSINFFPDKKYTISLRVKGAVGSIKFQVGNMSQLKGWLGNQTELAEKAADLKADWKLYQLDEFTTPVMSTGLSEEFRLIFTPVSGAILNINIDDIRIIAEASARPQYQCANDPVSGALCQYHGGYCGDGQIQSSFGENCDDRVGLSCTTNSNCGKTGSCTNNVCQSVSCNSLCKSTYCGDGIIQRPNSAGTFETCDYKSDPLCSSDCTHIKMGGSCTTDTYGQTCESKDNAECRVCASNLSCSIRNFGDADKKCLGARNSYGCKSDNDCILGYYCDTAQNKCKEEVSTYLRYHPEPETSLNLALPLPENSVSYDINISKCPDLRAVTLGNETYITDRCSNISWLSSDNITKIDANWNYTDALSIGCAVPSRLPTVAELYSLVSQTNSDPANPYIDKDILKLCPASCSYDENAGNLCSTDCFIPNDDNYLYWTSTCVAKDNTVCKKALAVNFKYGSIESYPATTNLKIHCLKETNCGDGQLDPGESCEFFTSAGGKIEKDIQREYNKSCKSFGYDGGILHCDRETCGIRVDNCYLNSRPAQSCEQVCQGKKTLACQSVGLDIVTDTFDQTGQDSLIASNNKMVDVDVNGNCLPNQSISGCNYTFNNREKSCTDTLTNKPAPFNSEYSYCNCKE